MSEFRERIERLSPAKRAILEMALARQAAQQGQVDRIPSRQEHETPVLSFAEQRLWFFSQLHPGEFVFNLPAAVRVNGAFDPAAFEEALGGLVRRHETLRTTFVNVDGLPQRRIAEEGRMPVTHVDLCASTAEGPEEPLQRQLREQSRRPFDLGAGSPARCVVYRLAADQWAVLLVMHHIISDGWSMGVLLRDLAAEGRHGRNRPGQPHAARVGRPRRLFCQHPAAKERPVRRSIVSRLDRPRPCADVRRAGAPGGSLRETGRPGPPRAS